MILDVLENANDYLQLNKGFAKAFEFLMRPDLKQLPDDRYEIDGKRIYVLVARGPGRKREDAQLEIHKKYLDIQLVLAGTDEMGWKPLQTCREAAGEYDPSADVQIYADEPDAWLATKPGAFAIFFPQDAHMPMISPDTLHKAVVKVAVL